MRAGVNELVDEQVSTVTSSIFAIVEADSYWCMTKLLDSIQENYTFAQPGIQSMVFKLQELVSHIDGTVRRSSLYFLSSLICSLFTRYAYFLPEC